MSSCGGQSKYDLLPAEVPIAQLWMENEPKRRASKSNTVTIKPYNPFGKTLWYKSMTEAAAMTCVGIKYYIYQRDNPSSQSIFEDYWVEFGEHKPQGAEGGFNDLSNHITGSTAKKPRKSTSLVSRTQQPTLTPSIEDPSLQPNYDLLYAGVYPSSGQWTDDKGGSPPLQLIDQGKSKARSVTIISTTDDKAYWYSSIGKAERMTGIKKNYYEKHRGGHRRGKENLLQGYEVEYDQPKPFNACTEQKDFTNCFIKMRRRRPQEIQEQAIQQNIVAQQPQDYQGQDQSAFHITMTSHGNQSPAILDGESFPHGYPDCSSLEDKVYTRSDGTLLHQGHLFDQMPASQDEYDTQLYGQGLNRLQSTSLNNMEEQSWAYLNTNSNAHNAYGANPDIFSANNFSDDRFHLTDFVDSQQMQYQSNSEELSGQDAAISGVDCAGNFQRTVYYSQGGQQFYSWPS